MALPQFSGHMRLCLLGARARVGLPQPRRMAKTGSSGGVAPATIEGKHGAVRLPCRRHPRRGFAVGLVHPKQTPERRCEQEGRSAPDDCRNEGHAPVWAAVRRSKLPHSWAA